jgi:excisionase family DNA binding protein
MSVASCGLSYHEKRGPQPLVVKPREAARMLDCGLTRIYGLLADGRLESFLDGRSRKITTTSIENHITRELAAQHGAKPVKESTAAATRARQSRRAAARARAP